MSDEEFEPAAEAVPADEETEEQRRRRMAFVAAAIAFAILLWWVLSHIASVPSTVGMSQARAGELIHFAGFETSVTAVPCEDKMVGRVLVQAPGRGLYFTWWPVRIAVGGTSMGADAAGNDVSFVIEQGAPGLELAVPGRVPEAMPTDPEEVLPLYYPPVGRATRMPDVQNMTQADASGIVRALGLRVSVQTGPSTTDITRGRVMYQNPAPGMEVARGQSATLWLSDGSFSVLSGKYTGYPYPRPPSGVVE